MRWEPLEIAKNRRVIMWSDFLAAGREGFLEGRVEIGIPISLLWSMSAEIRVVTTDEVRNGSEDKMTGFADEFG
jgi:hypothetical protein